MERRIFLKTLTAVGLSSTGIMAKSDNKDIKGKQEFCAILVDTTRCEGCQSCEEACLQENHPGAEEVGDLEANVIRETSEKQLTLVNYFTDEEESEYFVKRQCFHCNQPACTAACLTNAMEKTKEGPVIWHEDKCMGCRYCMISCPFDIPKFEYEKANPDIKKCMMCYHRLQKGELPACVDACPNEAIIFGTRREMLEEAKNRIYQNPDDYYHHIYGEDEVGGTGYLYLAAIPFEQLGFKTDLSSESLPKTTTNFLYSVPVIETLLPAFLLGISAATAFRSKRMEEDSNEK